MNDQPISDLRRRMLQDMAVRQFGEKTQHDYIRHIEAFARFLGRSPETVTSDDLRRFQFQQIADGAQPPKMNCQASALRFFLSITLGRADLAHQLARTHYPRKLPRILSPEDVARLLEAWPGPGLKYKAALSVAYGAGLRGGEVLMLRVSDIDSKRMLIRVEMGKGRKDRHCHALAAAARGLTRLVAAMPLERLAVPRQGPALTADKPAVEPSLPYGGGGGGAWLLGDSAYAAS
jgi:site-specific recombinase XerD